MDKYETLAIRLMLNKKNLWNMSKKFYFALFVFQAYKQTQKHDKCYCLFILLKKMFAAEADALMRKCISHTGQILLAR